eukprot:Gb_22826 [translate_table: standard]
MSRSYVGRSNDPIATIGLQNRGFTPPVNTTGKGHTAPTTTPSMRAITSLKAPLPGVLVRLFASTYSLGGLAYHDSSFIWNDT